MLALLTAVSCDDGATSPAPRVATQLAIAGGDDQVGEANADLPLRLSVLALDAHGDPVEGAEVSWTALDGGTVNSASTLTGPDGVASVTRRLGQAAGPSATRATLLVGPVAGPEVEFASFGLVQGALSIAAESTESSDSVFATVQHQVTVLGRDGGPVQGILVQWRSVGASGTLSWSASTTDANGTAEVFHTLGPEVGSQTVRASVLGLVGSPVRFDVQATPGAPAALIAPAGVERVSRMSDDGVFLAVLALDGYGNGVAGRTVDWAVTSGSGSVSSPSESQDDGDAIAYFAPAAEGVATVTAILRDAAAVPPLTFTIWTVTELVTALADVPGFQPAEVDIAVGKTVGWHWGCLFDLCTPVDVTFEDDPTWPVSSGAATLEGIHVRTFLTPGQYRYRATGKSSSFTDGMVGVVTVH